MKYDWYAINISYSIEITPEQLQLICDHDHSWGTVPETLSGRIDALEGLRNTDYNGHFGPYIFVNIDFPDDTYQRREKIEKVINDYTADAIVAQLATPKDNE